MLLNTDFNIKQIAYAIGYDNEFFFSRLFKKYTSISPTEFRNNANLAW